MKLIREIEKAVDREILSCKTTKYTYNLQNL